MRIFKKINFLILLFLTVNTKAQIYEPVKWDYKVEKLSDDTANLVFEATIDQGWHLYSQFVQKGGPIPTLFNFLEKGKWYELIGKTEEIGHLHQEYSEVFRMKLKYFDNRVTFKQKIRVLSNKNFKIQTEVEYMACNEVQCTPPQNEELEFNISGFKASSNRVKEKSEEIGTQTSSHGIWMIFITGFIGGLLALFTPCVFPMIPMTVSFFTKQSKNKSKGITNAIIYGMSIIIIYVVLGFGVTAVFGANAMNALSTNVWFNLFFFLILVIFALSFFGAFEIVLPSSFINKIDRKADKGGLIGIFFMAFTLALVSFSCTGPIIGTLLVEAAVNGGVAGPLMGMFGFALALALPFTVFAIFPGWMNSLPQSGGWLNSVKVVLGFLELAFSLKFLSNVDLVLQLHLLERELFLAIWIVIFALMGFYLLGKIMLPHDSPLEKISPFRLCLAILTFSFVLYLVPGLWGAPVNLISGFPPPKNYSESPFGVGVSGNFLDSSHSLKDKDMHLGPHGIPTFHDYEKGLEYAKKINKPMMIDFTGHACVNCRKMEDNVWSDERVMNILKNDLVLISLYVDDKRKLANPYRSEHTGKKIKTIGNKWSEFQTYKYKTNSQPYYVLIDTNEEKLNEPTAYNTDVDAYINWLKDGISKF